MSGRAEMGAEAAVAAAGPRRGERWWVAGLTLFGMALRVREALRTPFWFDELFTLQLARQPLAKMLPMLTHDIHPPLFTLLVMTWRAVGGESERWLKTLPLLIGLATLLATWRCARRMFGARVAVVALALLAVHPRHVYFSQELRGYGLLALAVTLATWAAWAWRERGTRGAAVGWVLAAALTLYTHYLGGVVLALIGGVVLLALRHEPARARRWVGLQLGVAVLFAPQVPMFLQQLVLSRSHWVPRPAWPDLVDLLRRIGFASAWLAPLLVLLVFLASTRGERRRPAAFVLAVALGSILLAFTLGAGGLHLFVARYMYFSVPLWCIGFAAGTAVIAPVAPRRLATGLMVAVGLRACWITPPLPEAVELRDTARLLSAAMRPGDRLFCADTHSLFGLGWQMGVMRGRLVTGAGPLPYYVGGGLVADPMRVPFDSVRAVAASGARWWGVRTREAVHTGDAVAAAFDSLARGGTHRGRVVQVWAGQPSMWPVRR